MDSPESLVGTCSLWHSQRQFREKEVTEEANGTKLFRTVKSESQSERLRRTPTRVIPREDK